VTSSVRSGVPGATDATSPTFTTAPLRRRIGVSAIRRVESHSPDTTARYCASSFTKRPTGASLFASARAAETSSTVSPAASALAGSTTTSISRLSLERTSTRPVPGTRASAGRTT